MRVCVTCGKESVKGFKINGICCVCYKKVEYQKFKAQGKCPQCGGVPRLNRVLCQRCVDVNKLYELKNKDRRISATLKRSYGITFEDKKRMYTEQNGLCALCCESLPESVTRCHVDHNHKTNRVRAVLHKRCNIMVGYLEDPLITKAKEYLEKHECVEMCSHLVGNQPHSPQCQI